MNLKNAQAKGEPMLTPGKKRIQIKRKDTLKLNKSGKQADGENVNDKLVLKRKTTKLSLNKEENKASKPKMNLKRIPSKFAQYDPPPPPPNKPSQIVPIDVPIERVSTQENNWAIQESAPSTPVEEPKTETPFKRAITRRITEVDSLGVCVKKAQTTYTRKAIRDFAMNEGGNLFEEDEEEQDEDVLPSGVVEVFESPAGFTFIPNQYFQLAEDPSANVIDVGDVVKLDDVEAAEKGEESACKAKCCPCLKKKEEEEQDDAEAGKPKQEEEDEEDEEPSKCKQCKEYRFPEKCKTFNRVLVLMYILTCGVLTLLYGIQLNREEQEAEDEELEAEGVINEPVGADSLLNSTETLQVPDPEFTLLAPNLGGKEDDESTGTATTRRRRRRGGSATNEEEYDSSFAWMVDNVRILSIHIFVTEPIIIFNKLVLIICLDAEKLIEIIDETGIMELY
jgi:hypothetical protein